MVYFNTHGVHNMLHILSTNEPITDTETVSMSERHLREVAGAPHISMFVFEALFWKLLLFFWIMMMFDLGVDVDVLTNKLGHTRTKLIAINFNTLS